MLDIFKCIFNFPKTLFDRYFRQTSSFIIGIMIILSGFYALNSFNLDITEHLNATYLVSIGEVPYKDFFEHHNPLMWYILSPFISMFNRSIIIFEFSSLLALMTNILSLYIMYRINADFLYDKKTAVLGCVFGFAIPLLWEDVATLRPDIFMIATALLGIYNIFLYLKNHKLKNLVISYLCMSFSFLFLQKIVSLLFGFALANLWLIYQKRIKVKDFAISVAVALLPLILYGIYLWETDSWKEYFYYNWIFMNYLRQYYDNCSNLGGLFYGIMYFNMFCMLNEYRKEDCYLILLMSVMSMFGALLLFAPHIQYVFPFILITTASSANFFLKYLRNYTFVYYVIFAGLLCNIYLFIPKDRELLDDYFAKIQYIIDNTTSEDDVFSTYPYTLYNKNTDYYWFGFANVVILDILHNDKRNFDFEEIVMRKRPKFLVLVSYYDNISKCHLKWFIERNQLIFKRAKGNVNAPIMENVVWPEFNFWKIDEKILTGKYREISPMSGIWQRIDD
ncbi:MAG: glycosyltransferase family 39 protein [Alphaproteobacteria bacterium]|nr:glycosyltransferase family 39 protein [Alphaproteobacteria bacterium]